MLKGEGLAPLSFIRTHSVRKVAVNGQNFFVSNSGVWRGRGSFLIWI